MSRFRYSQLWTYGIFGAGLSRLFLSPSQGRTVADACRWFYCQLPFLSPSNGVKVLSWRCNSSAVCVRWMKIRCQMQRELSCVAMQTTPSIVSSPCHTDMTSHQFLNSIQQQWQKTPQCRGISDISVHDALPAIVLPAFESFVGTWCSQYDA